MLSRFLCLIIFASLVAYAIIQMTANVEAFIKFTSVLNSTACDICDQLSTNSGRNVFCCLTKSKCCGPNSLDELDSLTTVTPSP